MLGVLTMQSSYGRNVEEPARGVPDTVQWWFLGDATWRVRTYAIDRDVHPHRADGVDVEFAKANVREHYGDVLRSLHVVSLSNVRDPEATRNELRAAGLRDTVQFSDSGIPLWLPDDARYESRSEPR